MSHPGVASLSVALLVLATGVLGSATAEGDFSSPALLSGTQTLQFDQASAPTISLDGEHAVFQGSLAEVSGVYERNLLNGQISLVAGANATEVASSAPDASAPSVSADGRYVAFTTTADLDPANEPATDHGCPEVYVRDMSLAANAPGAYTLVAALDGTSKGILFGGTCESTGRVEAFHVAGAQTAPSVAMSADGRHVAFTLLSYSNLARGSGCVPPTPLAECPPETPPSQVAVRDLDTQTTTLVTVMPEGHATTGGGAFPSTASENAIGGATNQYGDQGTGSSAALSADASTVAWLGTNVPSQVPGATDVEAGIAREGVGGGVAEPAAREVEPLWRRIADGPGAVTRRLLIGAGLDFYFPTFPENNYPVFGGSLSGEPTLVSISPALSADGRTVAVVAGAPSLAAEASINAGGNQAVPSTDAYVIHIDSSVSPIQVTPLTAIADYAASRSAVGDVRDIAISPDGTRVAFDTSRTQFTLPSPTLISPPDVYTGEARPYEANLALGTLQRVITTFDGSTPNGGSSLLAFSGDGQELTFTSQASNLFYGDAFNSSQVYLVHELGSAAGVAPQQEGEVPTAALPTPNWVLNATATVQVDGSVLVRAQLPGAGKLAIRATAQLPSPAPSKVRRSKSRSAKARKSKSNGSAQLLTREVAQAAAVIGGPSEVRLHLRVGARYRSLVAAREGLYSVLRLTFTAPHRTPLLGRIPVTLRRIVVARKQVKHTLKGAPARMPRTLLANSLSGVAW